MNTPAQVAENYLGTGKTKVSLSFGRMLALAILAGIYIALAGVGASCAAVTVESASLAKLVSGATATGARRDRPAPIPRQG